MSIDAHGGRCFSTLAPGFLADPYPAYARLRMGPPIFWSAAEGGWILHRYADIAAVLADPRFAVVELARFVGELCARGGKGVPDLEALLAETLVVRNPPAHTEARQFLVAVLTGRPLSSYVPTIEAIAGSLLAKAPRNEAWDAATQYADLLPPLFMARLLGLEDDEVAGFVAVVSEVSKTFDRGRSLRFYERVNRMVGETRKPLEAAIAERRRQPRDDGLSRMIAVSGERFHLDDHTLATRALFLLMVGAETTAGLIGNAIATVFDHRDSAGRLQANPGLIAAAIEETIRYDGPVQQITRLATTDMMIAGQGVSAGDRLVLLIGAANRDPSAFSEPDRFDLDRGAPSLLAFGGGLHFCLGARLARIEAQIALREFMTFRPRVGDPTARQWRQHRTLRRLAALPVILSQ